MAGKHTASIQALERKLREHEQKANEVRAAINVLCLDDGLPPRYNITREGGDGSPVTTQIRDDTFYGKKQQTAARMYLEMRGAQDLGPAKPREIYDALKAGGYQFQAKDEETALVGLRAMLRKRTAVFHKLPTGSYGLTSWYEDIKAQKTAEGADDDTDTESDEDENEDLDDEAADDENDSQTSAA